MVIATGLSGLMAGSKFTREKVAMFRAASHLIGVKVRVGAADRFSARVN